MATGTLTETVKTRIPPDWKTRLESIAAAETLQLSDIVRRALSEFIDRRTARQGKEASK